MPSSILYQPRDAAPTSRLSSSRENDWTLTYPPPPPMPLDPASDDIDMMDVDMVCDEELSATSNQEATKVFEQWLSDDDNIIICGSSDSNGGGGATTATASTSSMHSDDELALMEIDHQIGSNLLQDDVFGGPACGSGFGSSSTAGVGPFDDFCVPSTIGYDEHDHHVHDESLSASSSSLFPPLVEFQSASGIIDEFLQEPPPPATTLTTPPPGPPSPLTEDARYQEVLKKLEASMKRSQETRKSLTWKTDKTAKYERTKSVSGVLSSIASSSRQLQTYLNSVQCSAATA